MANRAGVFSTRSTAGPLALGPDGGDSMFIPVVSDRGPVDVVTLITSLPRFEKIFGTTTNFTAGRSYSQSWFAVKDFFQRGGKRIYALRVVGASAVVADMTLEDRAGVPVDTLTIAGKGPGSWANSLHVVVADGTETDTFRLTVYDGDPTAGGELIEGEDFDNLKMVSGDIAAVNGASNYIQLTDEGAATAAPANRPATGTYQIGTDGTAQTSGVDDNEPTASDIVGTESSGVKTGLKSFKDYALGRGTYEMGGLDQSTVVTSGTVQDVIDEVESQCATYNRLYFTSAEEGAAYAAALTARAQHDSVFTFFCWPRKKVVDPYSGEVKSVSCSAELIAHHFRAVQEDALSKVPAGKNFPVGAGSIGLESQSNGQPLIDDTVAGLLRARGINPLYNRDGSGPKCWGNRAATSELAWKSISAAYVYCYIQDNLRPLLDPLIYDDIDPNTFYSDIETAGFQLLSSMYDAGAFRGQKPTRGADPDPEADGFYIVCNEDLLSEADLSNDNVRVQAWFRERRSAETIFVDVARNTAV